MAKQYRADQVGSFLRPPELREAHTAFMQGNLPEEEIRRLEDQEILKVLEMQRSVGIEVLSDGEFRWSGWGSDFRESVDGYVPGTLPVQLHQHRNSDGSLVDAPSGATSFSRAASRATGRSAASSSSSTGAPRISRRAGRGAESKQSERPSSGRWSPGASPSAPKAHHSPP